MIKLFLKNLLTITSIAVVAVALATLTSIGFAYLENISPKFAACGFIGAVVLVAAIAKTSQDLED